VALNCCSAPAAIDVLLGDTCSDVKLGVVEGVLPPVSELCGLPPPPPPHAVKRRSKQKAAAPKAFFGAIPLVKSRTITGIETMVGQKSS
jgi:hypothetical protein